MATTDMGRKEGASVPLLRLAGTPSNTMWPGPRTTSVQSSVFIHPPFGHNRHGPEIGWGRCPLFPGVAGSPSSTVLWAEAYLHTKWHLDVSIPLATIEMGRKLGRGLRPLFGKGAGSLSNTVSSGPRPTSVPSGILIHAAVWPQ